MGYKCTLIVKLCLDVIAVLSATACSWLDEMLDWDHHGVNSDLYSIAEHMVDWEEKLAALLQLTDVEIHDLKKIHINDPPVLLRYSNAAKSLQLCVIPSE